MRSKKLVWKEFASLEGFVRLVLLVEWDAIGILGHPAAMNEYDSYAPHICSLLMAGATREWLGSHLRKIQTAEMGISQSHVDCEAAADRLLTVICKLES